MTTPEQLFENYGNNIWSPSIRRADIDRNNEELIEELRIHAQSVCRNNIGESYIYEALDAFTHGYVYYDDSQSESPILGFVVWEEKHNKAIKSGGFMSFLYVYLICTQPNDKHICRRIMYDIEVAALERKINLIELHSLDDKVNMYRHFGYKLVREDTLEMAKVIIPSTIHRKSRNSTRRIAQRRKNTRKQRNNPEDY